MNTPKSGGEYTPKWWGQRCPKYTTDNFIKEELCNSRPVLVTVRLNMDPNNQTYHMMVLTGMDNNYVYVNDPWKSNGQSYVYSKASFDACFNSSGRIVTYFR